MYIECKNCFVENTSPRGWGKNMRQFRRNITVVIERRTTTDVFIDEDSSAHNEAMAITHELDSAN